MVDLADVHHAVVGGHIGAERYALHGPQIEIDKGESLLGHGVQKRQGIRTENLHPAERQLMSVLTLQFAGSNIGPSAKHLLRVKAEIALRLTVGDDQ